jgi:predicted nucleic acid-binding protein
MIVDANVAVYWAVPGPHSEAAAAVMGRPGLSAPTLIMPEASNALLRHARAGTLSIAQVPPMVKMIGRAIETLATDAELVPEALELAIEHHHKIYDCLYLALALRRREPLATADRRLASIARGLSIETELIEPAI